MTLWVGVDIYSDKFQGSMGRDATGMLRVGGSFELRLSAYWNLFTTFEGNVLGSTRDIYNGLFRTGGLPNTHDGSPFAGRFGFTYKFH